MERWLKLIGKSTDPLRDDWGVHAPVLQGAVSFATEPGTGSFVPGDWVVYLALGAKRAAAIVAVGEVVGHVRRDPLEDRGFPFIVPVRLDYMRPFISTGFPLAALNTPGGRDLNETVKRRSHIRLSEEEFQTAITLFRSVQP